MGRSMGWEKGTEKESENILLQARMFSDSFSFSDGQSNQARTYTADGLSEQVTMQNREKRGRSKFSFETSRSSRRQISAGRNCRMLSEGGLIQTNNYSVPLFGKMYSDPVFDPTFNDGIRGDD